MVTHLAAAIGVCKPVRPVVQRKSSLLLCGYSVASLWLLKSQPTVQQSLLLLLLQLVPVSCSALSNSLRRAPEYLPLPALAVAVVSGAKCN